jgi:hypothetical protein
MHVLNTLKHMMNTNTITRHVEIASFQAALQLVKPEFFCILKANRTQYFIDVFQEIIKAIFTEEDFFFDNEYHKFNQFSSISVRFGVSLTVKPEDEQTLIINDFSEIESKVNIDKLCDLPPMNVLVYVDRRLHDEMKLAGDFSVSSMTWNQYPGHSFIPFICLCLIRGYLVLVNMKEKYAIMLLFFEDKESKNGTSITTNAYLCLTLPNPTFSLSSLILFLHVFSFWPSLSTRIKKFFKSSSPFDPKIDFQ